MLKCKVCGKEFELKKENMYLTDWINPITRIVVLHECFDCPVCGCQNMVNSREPNHDKQYKYMGFLMEGDEE